MNPSRLPHAGGDGCRRTHRSIHRRWSVLPVALALVAATLPVGVGEARAAGSDWFASVYTPEGAEVRGDERLFTLFALLNAMGYDQGPVVRKLPITKHEFSAIRQQVRHAVAGLDPKLRQEVDAFFDAHPLPLGRYAAYVAQLGPAPRFAPAAGDLAGFEKLLATFYADNHIRDLYVSLQPGLRSSSRAYLAQLDEPLKKVRGLLRDPSSHLVVVVNDLDGQGQCESVASSEGPVVIVGPSANPDVAAVIRGYVRAVLDPILERKSLAIRGAADQAAIVRGNGGPELESGAAYSSELLARAIALRVTNPNATQQQEEELKEGFAGIKDAVKAVDELGRSDKPLEAVLPDILNRVDLHRGR